MVGRAGLRGLRQRILGQGEAGVGERDALLREPSANLVKNLARRRLRVDNGQHGVAFEHLRDARGGVLRVPDSVQLGKIAHALEPLAERPDVGHQLDRRARERQARLCRRAEHDGAAAFGAEKPDRALKQRLAVLGQRLNLIEDQHSAGQPVQPSGIRVGRSIAGVEELHHAGQDDVAVPALGQALVGLLLLLLAAAVARLGDDVGVVLEDGGGIAQRLADIPGVLVEDGVVGDNVEDSALPIRFRMPERKAQAGKRLAAARGYAEREDTGLAYRFFMADIGNFCADAVDFPRAVQMGLAIGFKGFKERIPVGRRRRRGEGILAVFKARGIPAIGVDEAAEQQAAGHAQAEILLGLVGNALAEGDEAAPDLAAGRGETRVQLRFISDVFKEPSAGLIVMEEVLRILHLLDIGRLALFIQTVAQPRMVAQDAQRDELRRQPPGSGNTRLQEPAAIGVYRAGRRMRMRRRLPVRGAGGSAQIRFKRPRRLSHIVQQADEPRGLRQAGGLTGARAQHADVFAMRLQRLQRTIRGSDMGNHGFIPSKLIRTYILWYSSLYN